MNVRSSDSLAATLYIYLLFLPPLALRCHCCYNLHPAVFKVSTAMAAGFLSAFLAISPLAAPALAQVPGASSSYVVPAEFPASVFSSYYLAPNPTREPQPAVYDPVLKLTYPLKLTDPNTIPTNDTDPAILPKGQGLSAAKQQKIYTKAISQLQTIVASNGTSCGKCVSEGTVLQNLAIKAPALMSDGLVELCIMNAWHNNATCALDFGLYTFGSVWTQVSSRLLFLDLEKLELITREGHPLFRYCWTRWAVHLLLSEQ